MYVLTNGGVRGSPRRRGRGDDVRLGHCAETVEDVEDGEKGGGMDGWPEERETRRPRAE